MKLYIFSKINIILFTQKTNYILIIIQLSHAMLLYDVRTRFFFANHSSHISQISLISAKSIKHIKSVSIISTKSQLLRQISNRIGRLKWNYPIEQSLLKRHSMVLTTELGVYHFFGWHPQHWIFRFCRSK